MKENNGNVIRVKLVVVAIILTVLVNAYNIFSNIRSQDLSSVDLKIIDTCEKVEKLEARINDENDRNVQQDLMLARIDENLKTILEKIDELKTKVSK